MIGVLASVADDGGCGQYRVLMPAEAVNAADVGVKVSTTRTFDCDATFVGGKYHIRHVSIPSGVHVVSVQRPTHAAMAGMIQWLKACRPDIGIVVELDDDLLGVPTGNVAHQNIQRKNNPIENGEWLRLSLRMADVLTVSTPELARIYTAPARPTFVVRNGVPKDMLSNPSRAIDRRHRMADPNPHSDRIIGWAGFVGTHPDDLETTGGALADVVHTGPERSIVFRNIGPREGVAAGLGLREEQVEASGWLRPELYRVALGELDVGIVPLRDTVFNRCKSALKALEMAAAGVPVVASALPEFEELQRGGMPIWLAKDRRKHWSWALKRVLSMPDAELRELAQASREYVRRYATVEKRATQWADAWRVAAQLANTRVSDQRKVRTSTGQQRFPIR